MQIRFWNNFHGTQSLCRNCAKPCCVAECIKPDCPGHYTAWFVTEVMAWTSTITID